MGGFRKILWRKKITPRYRDTIFRRFISMLNGEVRVMLVKRIVYRKKPMYGLWYGDDSVVYIANTMPRGFKLEPKAKVLVHELLHALFPDMNPDPRVEKAEEILWRAFTLGQKRILRRYIPRTISAKMVDG